MSLTESNFGGYVTRLLHTNSPAGGGGRRTDDNNDENSNNSKNQIWDEESTTWSEFVGW